MTYVSTRFLLQSSFPALSHSLDQTRKEQEAQETDTLDGDANCGDETNGRNGPENEQDAGDYGADACANHQTPLAPSQVWGTRHNPILKVGERLDLLTVVINCAQVHFLVFRGHQ
jgi:hypothetical protein